MDMEKIVFNKENYNDKDNDKDSEYEALDDSLDWINEYKKEEKEYELFYKEPVDNVKLNFIYIGVNNEIQCINEGSVLLSNNTLNKDRLFEIITLNKIKNKIRYNLKYLLKYNFFLEPSNIIPYLKNKISENYLTEVKILEDIFFSNTISVMNDLNCLLFIFIEKPKEISISQEKNKEKQKHRITRKIMEKLRRRKTRRVTE